MSYRSVLVATDFSAASSAAAAFARSVAPEARAHVLHVRPMATPSIIGSPTPAETQHEREHLHERLRDWGARHVSPEARTHVANGSPRAEVAAQAERLEADLVIVGAKGESDLKDKLLGSTARRVVRGSSCDVLVTRGAAADPWPRHILLATDLGEPAQLAAARAQALAQRAGAEVTLAHALDLDVWRSGAEPRREEPEARRRLVEVNAALFGKRAQEVVATGRPAETLARLAAERRADIVVVGTHGGGALERAMLGSVAEELVERAPCSVLVAKRA